MSNDDAELTVTARSWTHIIKIDQIASAVFTFGNTLHSNTALIRCINGDSLAIDLKDDEITQFKAIIRTFEDKRINHEMRYRK